MGNGKGWHFESQRHSLAARGIPTTPDTFRARGTSFRPDVIEEVTDTGVWMTDPSWTCILEENDIHLGLYVEIIDLRGYDSSEDEKEYPFLANASVMVIPEEASPEFLDDVRSGDDFEPDANDILHYGGGVPASNFLEGIHGGPDSDVPSILKKDRFGRKNRYFKTYEDAEQYTKEVYASNAHAMFGLIGFLLDQPINLMGNDGWSIIRLQKKNENYIGKW